MTSGRLIGLSHELRVTVGPEHDAHRYGNPGVHTLATPALVELVERAAMEALQGRTKPGQLSLGTLVKLEHLAPTPLGMDVLIRVTVVEENGPAVVFDVEVEDERALVARGRHGRTQVDAARFHQVLKRKRR